MDFDQAVQQYDELAVSLATLESAEIDHETVNQTIQYVWNVHGDQVRKSGEPFAIHPIAVAAILAQHRLSTETVMAGLLHDVLEDTAITEEELRTQYGDEITNLVEGLTKIVRVARRGDPRRNKLATYRKLLLAASDDARVLVIKLADRLHNMRTIGALPLRRQEAIARETLEVYSPIAHRLGMQQIKEELQDLSFQVLDAEGWELADLLRADLSNSEERLEQCAQLARERLAAAGITATIHTRIKHRWSIHQKIIRRGNGDPLYDVLGMRVIVDNIDECYRTLGIIHSLWTPIFDRFHDYIAVPKANLYQSLHTTVNLPSSDTTASEALEIQIRTAAQDEIAEYGIAAHWRYKENLSSGGPDQIRQWIANTAQSQENRSLEEAFIALKGDVFAEEIYVCSPDGDIYILPQGSCPIDFAYAVHSELGDQCVGARISGHLRALNTVLKNGDIVEIVIREGSQPSRDWMNWVQSNRAKQCIRHFYQTKDEAEAVDSGWKLLLQRGRKVGLGPWGQKDKMSQALADLGHQNPDNIALEVSHHPEKAREYIRRIIRSLATDDDEGQQQVKKQSESGVRVAGSADISVRFAQCCSPQPGDSLIGYVSIGRGVSIHRRSCKQVQKVDSERLVDVEWDENASGGRLVLDLVIRDRQGIIVDIASCIYGYGGEIVDVHLSRTGAIVKGTITVWIPGGWEEVQRQIGIIDGVLRVRRSAI